MNDDAGSAAVRAVLARLSALVCELAGTLALLDQAVGPDDDTPAPEVIDDGDGIDDDNFAPLLDTTAAAERFGFPRDTIAKWCREGCGRRQGGRWLASVPLIQQRIKGAR
jgi:hypothetical protein